MDRDQEAVLELFTACTNSDVKKVKSLLDRDVDVNNTDGAGKSALYNVCVSSSDLEAKKEIAKMLIAKGATIDEEIEKNLKEKGWMFEGLKEEKPSLSNTDMQNFAESIISSVRGIIDPMINRMDDLEKKVSDIARHSNYDDLNVSQLSHSISQIRKQFNDSISKLPAIITGNPQFDAFQREYKQKFADLEKLSQTDKLTGIGNRHGLDAFLKMTSGTYTGIMIDLNDLKAKNLPENGGHPNGDKAIKSSVDAIKKVLNSSNRKYSLNRIGGDEVVILLENKQQIDALTEFKNIHTIANNIKKEMESCEKSGGCSGSIGIGSHLIKLPENKGLDAFTENRWKEDLGDKASQVAKNLDKKGEHVISDKNLITEIQSWINSTQTKQEVTNTVTKGLTQ